MQQLRSLAAATGLERGADAFNSSIDINPVIHPHTTLS